MIAIESEIPLTVFKATRCTEIYVEPGADLGIGGRVATREGVTQSRAVPGVGKRRILKILAQTDGSCGSKGAAISKAAHRLPIRSHSNRGAAVQCGAPNIRCKLEGIESLLTQSSAGISANWRRGCRIVKSNSR